MPEKYRHEYKHYINTADYFSLHQRLSAAIKPDNNSNPDGKYKIRSLYFDNSDDKALREKLDGINNREKFRIRYYGDNFNFIRLEKKSKINGLCLKLSAEITKAEVEKIINGDLDWMLQKGDLLIAELYSKMRYQQLKPKILVDYTREAYTFTAGNVRITIDSDIRIGFDPKDMFNINEPTFNSGKDIILEIKYDNFIPNVISTLVQTPNRKASAFSKYAVCRAFR